MSKEYNFEAEKAREEFEQVFKENIKREGSTALFDWLIKSDFFTAPSSSKYHCAFKGGLCLHSVNVYKRLKNNVIMEYGENYQSVISDESIAIMALLHDLCKTNFYKEDFRNVKVNGAWEQQPYYSVDDQLPYGHGEKSVYMISGFMKLTREEAMAINWHMGGFDVRVQSNGNSLRGAYYQFPLCVLLHVADLQATYLDEKE